MLWILLAILATAFFYWKFVKPYKYWTQKGVKHERLIFFGDGWKNTIQNESFADLVQRMYNIFPGSRYSGMYQMRLPTLVVRDPELIREIAVENFDHFTDHVQVLDENVDPLLAKNLFALTGKKWHDTRSTLNPAFTSFKMKSMFGLISNCSEKFVENLIKAKANVNTIEFGDTFSRFANDVIATCAFGVRCDSLDEPENEFYIMGKKATDFTGFWQSLRVALLMISPALAKFLGVTLFSKTVKKYFTNLVGYTVKYRETTNIVRPDMIQLLMDARERCLVYEEQQSNDMSFGTAEESDGAKSRKAIKTQNNITDMTAQLLVFFLAGFDSVATLMCFICYELGINPDIQERLRQEVDETLLECSGNITYTALNNMKYLDMVVAETLRKWPPIPASDRRCVNPYTIQPQNPDEQPVTLVRDDAIWLPIYSLHRDPKFYPNPDKFDPERFSDENKSNIKPYTYMPFGVGPRKCLGSKFGVMEAKILYFHLLSKFEIVVVEKTQIPLKLSKKGLKMNAENGFWLGLKKRSLN